VLKIGVTGGGPQTDAIHFFNNVSDRFSVAVGPKGSAGHYPGRQYTDMGKNAFIIETRDVTCSPADDQHTGQ
jgi:hypothetical protein